MSYPQEMQMHLFECKRFFWVHKTLVFVTKLTCFEQHVLSTEKKNANYFNTRLHAILFDRQTAKSNIFGIPIPNDFPK